MNRLAVVIPVYNEQDNIAVVLREWSLAATQASTDWRLLVIDDGSKDCTAAIVQEVAKSSDQRIELFSKPNSGHGRTCRFGYERALESGADWVLQVDSDGQCDPAYFPQFVQHTGTSDCIFGFRNIRQDGLVRWLISRVCSILTALRTMRWLGDANVPYRLMRSSVLGAALATIPADFDMQNVALTLALRRQQGLRWKWIPIVFRPRQGGQNSINLSKIVRMGWRMLRDLSRVG
jgi:glycosyltransferase involved in cell wall biosynthesis